MKQSNITGGHSQQEADLQDVCDMAQSQDSARVAALTALGYNVPVVRRASTSSGSRRRYDTTVAKGAPVVTHDYRGTQCSSRATRSSPPTVTS